MQFHLYGFIVGLAIVSGFLVTEQLVKQKLTEKVFYQTIFYVAIGGVLGARLWHVATDFYLYQDNLWGVFSTWNGGLSILGAITGGLIGFYLVKKKYKVNTNIFLDGVAFGLPIAQFIGRWANFFNQELYGLPTNLPWKIYIKPENRLMAFASYSYFHPLFLYEGILVLLGLVILLLTKKKNVFKLGTGKFFLLYLFYYGLIRFFLDFLRIDRQNWSGLGINQWVILCLELIFIGWFIFKYEKKVKKLNIIIKFCCFITIFSLLFGILFIFQKNNPKWARDHDVINWRIANKDLRVEVVNTTKSIELGLGNRDILEADAMLFVFPSSVTTSFWMANMKFPIDLYWIRDGKIIGKEENMLPPEEIELITGELEIYDSPGYIDMVLEVPVSKNLEIQAD